MNLPRTGPTSRFQMSANIALVLVALSLCFVALIVHARRYEFLTDDAYISFRYARNLSHGHGLVFNPGLERVEGYSNFLWTVILAGLDRLGLSPEHSATPLSMVFTALLWLRVVAFAWKRSKPGQEWLVVLPAFLLALTRSVAVWSSSGLETRLFEFLVVHGVLCLVDETSAVRDTGRAGFPFGAFWLGLAALTRPDGLLIAVAALVVTSGLQSGPKVGGIREALLRTWPCAVLVVGLLAFRLWYYHAIVPNTYYTKIDGRMLWASGLRYLAAFALEYSLVLWLPALWRAAGSAIRLRDPLSLVALTVLITHTTYVAAIGGDHFEYRPLGLWFPFGFLLLHSAVAEWLAETSRPVLAGAYGLALAAGILVIPEASHREFPVQYRPGFPGGALATDEGARTFLDPARDPILRLPGFALVARTHQGLTRWLTRRYIAVRAEEHRLFHERVSIDGRRLKQLMDKGTLPHDAYMAMSSIGVIPYLTDAPTLDRLGLTDGVVARQRFTNDLLAHGKQATVAYARQRGVDLWFVDPVFAHASLLSRRILTAAIDAKKNREDPFIAEVAPDTFLLCLLPRGLDETARRIPNLRFMSLRDPSVRRAYFDRAITAQRQVVAGSSTDPRAVEYLGVLLRDADRYAEAATVYGQLSALRPQDPIAHANQASCLESAGDLRGALSAWKATVLAARKSGRASEATAVARHVAELERSLSTSSTEN